MFEFVDQKDEINYESLEFPLYRKLENRQEWYRFDSLQRLISIRKNNVIGLGISQETPKHVFDQLYFCCDECSKEEFKQVLNSVVVELLGI